MKKLNPSIKHHLFIGVFISLWIFLFAFFIRPFEHGIMDFKKWVSVSVGFSLIAFLCYALTSFLQKFVHQKVSEWSIRLEIMSLLFFYVLYSISTYFYYKSSIINGIYDFPKFFVEIILIAALILTPILILVRIYSIKLIPEASDDITIKGDNKLDILKIKQSELICISNSQNYVEIFFLDHGELKSKLIRSSLKNIQTNFDFLIQVHRSH